MQELQKKAKEILDREKLASMKTIPEVPVLNEKLLRKKRLEHVELKIPVFVPLSTIRKEKHMPPNYINQVLPNGEVMPIYVVGDPTPRYDPLIKMQHPVPTKNYNREYRESVDATAHSHHDEIDSVFYYKLFKNAKYKKEHESLTPDLKKDLIEPPTGKKLRPTTPTGIPYVWMFRELEYENKKVVPKRKWVSERMNKYYKQRVKKDFLPKIDPNKSLELELNKEKQNFPLKSFNKVKFLK